ncbi:MAG TPA: hypothetical protein VGP46_12040, partial [Acidimicrobiales bacterium]|nr:hypothetical protein [Acidimicrobiales bacterium]
SDFVAKAQLASYESVRAQFEAFAARARAPQPATGVVYWMLNSAWPSLNWQLWDRYLDPAAAYFAARKAHEPLHVQYDYSTGEVLVANRTGQPQAGLEVTAALRDLSGRTVNTARGSVAELGDGLVTAALAVSLPGGIGPTYFLELTLDRAGGRLARNVYWLSTVPDVLALEDTTWQYTPTRSFADLKGLESLPPPSIEAAVEARQAADGSIRLEVSLSNPSGSEAPALGLHACLVSGPDDPVAPTWWEDNDVVLFGGQSMRLTGSVPPGSVSVRQAADLAVELEAFGLQTPLRLPAELA